MNFSKVISYGLLLWVLMFAVISAFVGFKIYDNVFVMILSSVIGGVISYILAKKLKPENTGMALSAGLMFVLIGVILDAIVSTRFNPSLFSQWTYWFSYILVFLVPVLAVKSKQF